MNHCSQCKIGRPVYDWGKKGVFCSKACVIGNLMDVPAEAFENILRNLDLDDIANLRLVDRDSEVKARRYYFQRTRITLRPEIFERHAAIVPDILHVLESASGGTLTARLPNVESVRLRNSRGNVNWDALTSRVTIKMLNLMGQEIHDVPNSIARLRQLTYLNLSSNNIDRLPIDFTQLTLLTVLVINTNQLWELPDDIGKLKNLEELDVSKNRLIVLPESFGGLSSLTLLNLKHNRLESLPESFGNLQALAHLDLSFNVGLRGLPNSFFNLRALRHLDTFKTRIVVDQRLEDMGINQLHD